MNKDVQQQLLKLVKKNYEEIAEDYDRTRRKHSDPLFTELKKHAQRVQKGDKVLDAGCGNGRLLELLPEQVEYLGVDSSEKLIKICRERFSSYRFRVMDILNLKELEEKEFDHIFSVAVLHQIPGKKWRVEAEFVYPNKEDKMTVILPKTSIINPNSPSLVNMDSPENISFEFDQEEVENSVWEKMEFGRIAFGKVM